MESKKVFFLAHLHLPIYTSTIHVLLAMVHTFWWDPSWGHGRENHIFWGGNQTWYPGRFSGVPFAPWNFECHEFFGWWKKLEEYSYYFHIWVFVINPTVRVYIYPLYVVGGNSKIFSIFSPRMFGEDFIPFWRAGIFFEWVGWNHQLVIQWPPCCNGKCG